MSSRIITRGFGVGGSAPNTVVTRGYGEVDNPPVPPSFNARDPRRELLLPGIRWANVPHGNPSNIVRNGARVEHVNVPMGVVMTTSDLPNLSGVIRFRSKPLPLSISSITEGRNTDRFGNTIYPGKGS